VLKQELSTFKRKVSLKTGHDSYEHWRESDHDDLVLAAALACWGTRKPKGASVVSYSYERGASGIMGSSTGVRRREIL
jgi:hypothetical protein